MWVMGEWSVGQWIVGVMTHELSENACFVWSKTFSGDK